jgi:hypothetical protein
MTSPIIRFPRRVEPERKHKHFFAVQQYGSIKAGTNPPHAHSRVGRRVEDLSMPMFCCTALLALALTIPLDAAVSQ